MEVCANSETEKLEKLGLVSPPLVKGHHKPETASGIVLNIDDGISDVHGVKRGSHVIFRDPTLQRNGEWYNPFMVEYEGKKCMFIEFSDILLVYV